ncbi:MAG: VCBS repeat-containing protein, partial [Blastocatellia bacterium]
MVHSKLCRITLLAILSACILLPTNRAGAFDSAQIQLAVDTANTSQDGLLTLYGGVRLGGELGLPVASGDMNHDGHGDVAFCEMYATSGVGTRPNNGQVDIYMSDGSDSGVVDAGTNPSSISTLIGRSAGDLLGTSVAMGDVNGDGFSDLVVSATGSDGPNGTRTNCGAVYVVPGSAGFNLHADLGATGGTPPNG